MPTPKRWDQLTSCFLFPPASPRRRLLTVLSSPSAFQLEIIILRSNPDRVVVRNNRISLYNHHFTEKIPPFSGSYFLGGVPEDKMPAK